MSKRIERLPVSFICILLIVIPHLIFVLGKWHAVPILDGVPVGQTDPDTWLRLTLVRDWLAGGSWYDHLVHHSNTPLAPIGSPWTRPVDLVIAFFVHLQPADVDLSLRITRAALLLPVLWMGLMLAGMMRATRLIAPYASAYVMVMLLVITQTGVWNYFLIGNADHHAPLAALFVWVLVGILTPRPTCRLMVITGILFALQLWISVETLILIGAVYTYYGIGWLLGDREKSIALTQLATSVALGSFVAVLIERPADEWLTPVYDSISIVYVTALTLCAITAWLLRLVPARNMNDRFFVALVGFLLIFFGLGHTYPHIIMGPTYGVDPFIMSDFLPRITEAQPFYKIPVLQILPFIICPFAAIFICIAPWIEQKRAFYDRRTSATLAFFVIATTGMYYTQQRWSYYMLPVSIIAIAPLLGALYSPENPLVSRRWPASLLAGLSPQQQMKMRLPVSIALLGMPFMLMVASAAPDLTRNTIAVMNIISPPENELPHLRNQCYQAARQLIRSGELDHVLPRKPQNILAPTDIGTELLFFTPHRIVASNYHREGAGIKYVWSTDTLTDEKDLRAHLRERHIEIVLACPKIVPIKDSLLQSYVEGKKLPSWLQRIPYELPSIETAETPAPHALPLLVKVQNP